MTEHGNSNTPRDGDGAPDTDTDPVLDLGTVNQQQLAVSSRLSPSMVSRLLSPKPKQSRPNPGMSTLRKLQTGLRAMTGHTYTLDVIVAAIAVVIKVRKRERRAKSTRRNRNTVRRNGARTGARSVATHVS